MNKVQVWKEKVIIPTYEAGKPDKNPMFLEKRVYQGSSGRIYPHTVIEKISDEKVDKEYIALFLENDYLKVMMLPELGGMLRYGIPNYRLPKERLDDDIRAILKTGVQVKNGLKIGQDITIQELRQQYDVAPIVIRTTSYCCLNSWILRSRH